MHSDSFIHSGKVLSNAKSEPNLSYANKAYLQSNVDAREIVLHPSYYFFLSELAALSSVFAPIQINMEW